MTEQRRARFASIEGLETKDLVLAGEIWLDDVMRSSWATKEAMKLAAQIVRYLGNGNANQLSLVTMETQLQLAREEVRRSLSLMQSMNAIEAHTMEKDTIHVALHLSQMQQLRVLEAKLRFDQFAEMGAGRLPLDLPRQSKWAPKPAPELTALPTTAVQPEQRTAA